MIYITINSKGGVGKSTLANQILPPYLFLKNYKKAKLIEIDDENNDSVIIDSSDILEANTIHTKQIKTIDEIFIDDEDVIIDIGGNKTATIFLDEMKKIGEFDNVVWFIPVGQGLQDTANALDTHKTIKTLDEDANIIFLLSNNRSSDIKWEYLHYFRNEFLDTPFAIPDNIKGAKHVVIKSADIVNNAKTFGKTVYDIAQNTTDFRAEAKKAKAEGKDDLKRKYLFLNRVKNEAIEYNNNLVDNLYIELDELLK